MGTFYAIGIECYVTTIGFTKDITDELNLINESARTKTDGTCKQIVNRLSEFIQVHSAIKQLSERCSKSHCINQIRWTKIELNYEFNYNYSNCCPFSFYFQFNRRIYGIF